MSDSHSTRTISVEGTAEQSAGVQTIQPSRQQDYRIFVRQRVYLGPDAKEETTEVAPPPEVRAGMGAGVSTRDEIASGTRLATRWEIKAPRAHLQNQRSTTAFTLLSKFDGVILRRNGRRFWARLWQNPNDPEKLEAEFDVSELFGSEEKIAQEGTPIVWTVGYAIERGTRKRQSILYVRRVPPVSDEEVVTSGRTVKEKMGRIRWKKD